MFVEVLPPPTLSLALTSARHRAHRSVSTRKASSDLRRTSERPGGGGNKRQRWYETIASDVDWGILCWWIVCVYDGLVVCTCVSVSHETSG